MRITIHPMNVTEMTPIPLMTTQLTMAVFVQRTATAAPLDSAKTVLTLIQASNAISVSLTLVKMQISNASATLDTISMKHRIRVLLQIQHAKEEWTSLETTPTNPVPFANQGSLNRWEPPLVWTLSYQLVPIY